MQLTQPIPMRGLSGTVGWSAVVHVVFLVALAVMESLTPKSVVFRDAIQVNLLAPEPPAALAPPAAKSPAAPPKLPPKGDPLWDKLAALADTPVVTSSAMADAFKALAPASQKKPKTPPPVVDDELQQWLQKLAKHAPAPTSKAAADKEPEASESSAEMWRKLKEQLGAEVDSPPAASDNEEISRFFEQLAASPASGRQSKARAKGGTPKYLAAVERRINARWSPPDIYRGQEQIAAVLMFPVLRDGSLGVIRLVTSSGSSQFDQAAQRAVLLAAPFSAFPEEMQEPRMDVRFTFTLAGAGAS